MAPSSKPYILFFTIVILSLSAISLAKATKLGFTVDLIHRDSPISPLYDNSTTPFQKLHNALRRSTKRLNYIFPNAKTIKDDPESDLKVNGIEYIMTYSLGTPEFQTFAFADTGSDLLWLQCLPCLPCFPQDIDTFDPLNSSTHVNVRCNSKRCESARLSVSDRSCNSDMCRYKQKYADSVSTSVGSIDYDTLTLASTSGGKVKFPKFTFGCGYNNSGKFSRKVSGIVGLGRGPLSLVSQISNSIERKFSYCFVPFSDAYSGKLRFGQSAIVSGPDVVSTPLVLRWPPNFYHLTLEAMSVGDRRIEWTSGDDSIILHFV